VTVTLPCPDLTDPNGALENTRFSEPISHVACTVLSAKKDECMNVEQFREYGRRAFRFLIEQYGFREVPPPEGKFVNEYMVCFSNGVTWVGVEGISYGFGISVSLASHDVVHMQYPTYCFKDLLDVRSPGFPLPTAKPTDTAEIQKTQMDWYAAALRVHAKDVLRGDFAVFPQLAEAITNRGGQPNA